MMDIKNSPTAVILGGDHRMAHTAKVLEESGFAVIFRGRESGACPPTNTDRRCASLVVLPIPVTRDGEHLNAPLSATPIPLAEVVLSLRPQQVVASGTLPPSMADALRAKGCRLYDYQADESFAQWNALATAEGAIAMAIAETDGLLLGSQCAVLGFGRIAKQLCRLLSALGAKVTVLARKKTDLALAATLGYAGVPLIQGEEALAKATLVFNTVPKKLFDFSAMKLSPDATVIDLAPIYDASDSPKVIRGAALPSKYAPAFAGRLIGDCILAYLREKEESV
ncbi:MAG: NAD(P)-binding domain-containing protein [Clostridia bacterium]|nr:NAD(P)-binding domain-containing protein [Clostridia bacterium]